MADETARHYPQHLDQLLDSLFDGLLIIRTDGTVLTCNKTAADFLGYPSQELPGMHIQSLYLDGNFNAENIPRLVKELIEKGTIRGETILKSNNSGQIPANYCATLVKDSRGNPAEIVLAMQNIITQKRRELRIQSLAKFPGENPYPVLRVSRDCTLLYANRGSHPLLKAWNKEYGEALPPTWCEEIVKLLDSGQGREIEISLSGRIFSFTAIPVSDMGYVNLYGRDITARKDAEEKLLLDAQVFENASEGIIITDAEIRVVDVNRAFTAITGYSRQEIIGRKPGLLSSGRHNKAFYREMWQILRETGRWRGEIWDKRKNGEVHPVWLSMNMITDKQGKTSHYVGAFSDLSSIKQTEEHLYHITHFDGLTGLPNRRSFKDRLEQAIQQAKRGHQLLAVMWLDLDGFKMINETLGHRAGDELLAAAADRLRDCLRESDTLGRMGSDEFALAFTHLEDTHDVLTITQKIRNSLARPIVLGGQELTITASIGITLFWDDNRDSDVLLGSAGMAMQKAKEQGRNSYQFYSRAMNEKIMEQLKVEGLLKRGLERGEFLLHYQPQLEIESGRLRGFEALLRWNSGDLGSVPPDKFIPLAEETGFILPLGEWALRTACKQAKTWQNAGHAPVQMGINLSASQFQQRRISRMIEDCLAESGLEPQYLELELTESMLVENIHQTIKTLERLKDMGTSLAIDDFGTGYSSLSYLRRFPIDKLKIDKSFVRDIPSSIQDAEIASAIIALGKSLKLKVIAEGVETKEQVEFLKEKGCHLMQGHYCSPAAPPEELHAILESLGCNQSQ